MAITYTPIYLSTLLLEKNRWNGKGPSLVLADCMEKIAEAGFVGLETWMNHLFFISRSDWELMRDKSLELDLPMSILSSDFPSDASEKSARFRESILEACEYFEPGGLHITSGDFPLKREKTPVSGQAWRRLREWCRDLPRHMPVFLDFSDISVELLSDLEKSGRFEERKRFKLVVEPFNSDPDVLNRLMDDFGEEVAHAHVHLKKGDTWLSLREGRQRVFDTLAILKRKGYKGSWSLYLTKGTGQPGEYVDDMLAHAEDDLNFLNAAWSRLD